MQRKAGADRPEPDHGRVSPAGALRLAVSRAAQEVLKVPLRAGDVAETRLTLASMAEALPPSGLWVMLRGPGTAAGLVTLDTSLLSAVLQALTAGRVSGSGASDRAPTQTDAILARRFLTVLVETFAARLEGSPAARWAAGFQPRDRVSDPARLPHLMADAVYRGMSVGIDIAGLRPGALGLILPHDPPGDGRQVADIEAGPDPRVAEWQSALADKVMDSPVPIEAVLHRLELPLADLSRLRPDMLLPLPAQAITAVSLEGADGRRTGTGRLGRSEGHRAVKILALPQLREDDVAADPRAGRAGPLAAHGLPGGMAAPGAAGLPARLPQAGPAGESG